MTEETIQDRVERAQSQNMEVTIVDTDPLVVQVYNEASNRIHTVIPESVHCSCEDSTYRATICKHLITLMQSEGHISEETREALKQERNEIGAEITDATERLNELKAERDAIVEALGAVGASQMANESIEDLIRGMEAEKEAVEEAPDKAPFEQMVEDLSGGAE